MALISVAVANSPAYERVWIEDIYQNIYCGAAHGIRKQATGIVADWRTRYGRKPDAQDDTGLSPLNVQATRACGNGEPVLFDMTSATAAATAAPVPSAAAPAGPAVLPAKPDAGGAFLKGPSGVGLRGIDASASASAPAAP